MITRLKVKNYRSIEEIDLTLSPLTVLVGKNGAGKSTILDVLAFVRDALNENLASAIKKRGSINSLIRWTSNNTPLDIEIEVEFANDEVTGRYSFTFGKFQRNGFNIISEECVLHTPKEVAFIVTKQETDFGLQNRGKVWVGGTAANPDERLSLPLMREVDEDRKAFGLALTLLIDLALYNIAPDDIRNPQEVTYRGSFLGDGSNIGEVLSQIAGDEREHRRFCEMLGYMVEGVEDFRVTEAGGYYITELKHSQEEGKSWFNLAHESEGTLKALAFLAAIYQEHTHSLIALEEPDANLYHWAVGGVSDSLREGLLRRQIIVTTQSRDFLSYFDIDELRIVDKVNGITKVGMLDATQRKAVELNLFSVSDLVRIEGLRRDTVEEEEAVVA